MGNRTFLFVHSAQQTELKFEHCVAETNNRFALEWFAWVPQTALDEHISTLHRIKPQLEANDDDSGSSEHESTSIRIPYAQAIACFRQSLFRMLRTHPTMAPALRDLFLAVEEHARCHVAPVLTLDCIEMVNFTDVDGYLQDVQIHQAFWQQRTPWEQVSFSTELDNPQGQPYRKGNHESNARRRQLEQELSALKSSVYPIVSRWRDRHEDAISWMLALLAAATFFAVYVKSGSWLLGGLAFLVTAVGLTQLMFCRPRTKVRTPNPQTEAQIRMLQDNIQVLRIASVPTSNLVFDVSPCWQKMPWRPVVDAIPNWDEDTVTVRSWYTGQRVSYLWNDIEEIGYDADDGGTDAALVGNIELTDAADESGRYKHAERPLWFEFAQEMEAHLMVLMLRLLHRVKTAGSGALKGA